MSLVARILAFLLLATQLASVSAAQLPFSPTRLAEHRSGCHEHGGKTPAQAPNHDCCLTGHDVAVLQVSHVPRPLIQGPLAALELQTLLDAAFSAATKPSSVSSPDPPDIVPLRI